MSCNLENGGKIWLVGILLCSLSTVCGPNLEDPEPPARPQWVAKSAPDDSLETGIDADPSGDIILLEWYNGAEEDLAFYRLYRAENPDEGRFELLTEVQAQMLPGEVITYIDEGVKVGTDYAYFLRAVDQAGNRSVNSDTVFYRLIPKVDILEPHGTISSTKPVFKWRDMSSPAFQYVIRVEDLTGSPVCWVGLCIRQNYLGEIQSLSYGACGNVYQKELTRNKSYRWRIDGIYDFDRDGNEIAGSESNWGYFTIQ